MKEEYYPITVRAPGNFTIHITGNTDKKENSNMTKVSIEGEKVLIDGKEFEVTKTWDGKPQLTEVKPPIVLPTTRGAIITVGGKVPAVLDDNGTWNYLLHGGGMRQASLSEIRTQAEHKFIVNFEGVAK